MPLNDSTGEYLKSRENAELTPAQALMAKQRPAPEVVDTGKEPFEFMPILKDVGRGLLEATPQAIGGFFDAAKEAGDAAASLIEALGIPSVVALTNEKGEFDLDLVTRQEFAERGGETMTIDPQIRQPKTVTGGLVRSVAQFLTGFLPASRAVKAVGITGKVVGAAVAGAAADAIVFDPHEARLSNLIESNPDLQNPVSGYLAAQPDDSEAEGRFKNAIEGLGLGALTEGFFHAVKGVRASRRTKITSEAAQAEKDTIERIAATGEAPKAEGVVFTEELTGASGGQNDLILTAKEGDEIVGTISYSEVDGVPAVKFIDVPEGARRKGNATKLIQELQRKFPDAVIDFGSLTDDGSKLINSLDFEEIPLPDIKAKQDQLIEVRAKLKELNKIDEDFRKIENPTDAQRSEMLGKTKDFNDLNDLERELAEFEGVKSTKRIVKEKAGPVEVVQEKPKAGADGAADEAFTPFEDPTFKVGSKKAGAEAAQNINLSKLDTADDVKELIDRTGEKFSKDINEARREIITHEETQKLADDLGMTVESLMSRRKGEAFNAEQALAARQILVASGENLVALAKAAAAGSDVDVIKFRKAMSNHHAIQLQVSGATAEAGRALQAYRISAKSEAAQTKAIKEALEAGGGAQTSRDIASQFAQLEHPHQVNTFIRLSARGKVKDILFEAWINGLLSSPATHAVNVLGNSITAAWSVGERKVASMIGAGLDFQNIPEGEATAALFGMVQGSKDGMRLAWKALKTGEPADVVTKLESAGHKALSAENLNLTGTAGRFADFMGETVRIPGRLLTASDEFFKSMGYRMELQAQAFRQASGEGLQGDDLARRIHEIIENPPENLDLASVDAARYQTFTKPLEEGGQALQDFVKKVPGARVIVPFIRTPVNIMKYAGERTILAPLSKNVRAEIAAGGARRDLQLAKIATGSMVMAAAADYSLSGQVTGGGPQNPAMRNLLRATGWQPYSIKVDDTYYSYSRLDPIGALIGMSADVTEIMGQTTDADALDLATSAVIATAGNVTSKTYLRGVSEFFDVMSSVSPDPDARNKRASRWIQRLAGSAIPSGVAQLERQFSPEMEAANGILEKIKSRVPGYSDDLPPRRNIFGEPIVLSGGLGPDIMSPIYTSTDKKDAIADEIVKQQTLLRMPRNIIDGVDLDTHQYDKYIQFYAGKNNRFVKQPLKDKLREVFNSSLYQGATDGQEGGKSTIIKSVFEAYRNAAKGAMMEEDPRLFMEINDIKRERAVKLGAGQ